MKAKIVQHAVAKALNDIADGERLSIRRLVSLGANFSKNDYSRYFFALIENLLADSDSNYYRLVNKMIKNIDRHCLQTFAINLGYHSFVAGADTIRLKKAAGGEHISWYCQLPPESSGLEELIREQEGRGVRFFYRNVSPAEIEQLLPIISRHPQSDYIFFATSAELGQLKTRQLLGAANLLISLPADNPAFNNATAMLAAANCHFGSHLTYGNASYRSIINDHWQKIIVATPTPYLFLLPAGDLSDDVAGEIYRYAKQYRLGPRASIFLIDFFGDLCYIDDVLNGIVTIPQLRLATAALD
jgi:hypothetical protein